MIIICNLNVTEDPRNFDLDQVDSFREYVFGRDGESRRNIINDELEDWPGRWMPDRPNDPTPPPKIFPKISETSVQSLHGIPMGYSSQNCDDAKVRTSICHLFHH